MFESQLLQVQDKLSQVFVDKFEQLQCGVDALNDRISIVEREFSLEKDRQTREAEEKHSMIANEINALQVGHLNVHSACSRQKRSLLLGWNAPSLFKTACKVIRALLYIVLGFLQHAFESDKGSRQERELQLAKRLGDLEYRTEGKFDAEKVDCRG